ncbi:MAG: hypothetical protein K2X81_17925 [Candidatus Obscuribacterales bacterium]|nr:hypothetical protein [Candidatus Obscuribacterales bacterium]
MKTLIAEMGIIVFCLLGYPNACLAKTILVEEAMKKIDALGLVALKEHESFESHRKLDKGVEAVVEKFKTTEDLLKIAESSRQRIKELRCDAPHEMHCAAYESACSYCIYRLGKIETPDATKALLKIAKLVHDSGSVSLFVQETLAKRARKH